MLKINPIVPDMKTYFFSYFLGVIGASNCLGSRIVRAKFYRHDLRVTTLCSCGSCCYWNESIDLLYHYNLLQHTDLKLNVSIKVKAKCWLIHLSWYFALPELFKASFCEMIIFTGRWKQLPQEQRQRASVRNYWIPHFWLVRKYFLPNQKRDFHMLGELMSVQHLHCRKKKRISCLTNALGRWPLVVSIY